MGKSTWIANIPNMRGKREHRFGCGCCTAIDLRAKLQAKQARKEAEDAIASRREGED